MSNYIELFGEKDELSNEHLQYLDTLKLGADALHRCYSIYSSHEFKTKNGWNKELINGDVSVYSTTIEQGRLFNLQVSLIID